MIIIGELAQQIVTHIMPLVKQNINIMDNHGIIIGSGQQHRINTFHQGAKDVLQNGQVLEIYPGELDQYPGSQPGVNLPIILEGHTIGVVGISGHPDVVRNTAQIIKVATELILERELLREEFRSHTQLKEEFAHSLLAENPLMAYEKTIRIAKLLNFDIILPRFVAVIHIDLHTGTLDLNPLHDLIATRTRDSLLQSLANSDLITKQDLCVFPDEKLIILKHLPRKNQAPGEMTQLWGEKLLEFLTKIHPHIQMRMGIGGLSKVYTELSHSNREAICALSNFPEKKLACIYDFDIMSSFLTQSLMIAHPCLALNELKEKIHTTMGTKYDMHSTITCLLNNNLNITNTAKSMYIHRNTLLFRLEKLKQITGLDPCHSFNHSLLCKILFQKKLVID